MLRTARGPALACLVAALAAPTLSAQQPDARLDRLKDEAIAEVQDRSKQVQEIVDMLFSQPILVRGSRSSL